MKDESKTKKQLITELRRVRKRTAKLEKVETERERIEQALQADTSMLFKRRTMGTTFHFWNLQNRREHRTPCTRTGRSHRTKIVSIVGGCGCNNPRLDVKPNLPAGDRERLAPAKKYL